MRVANRLGRAVLLAEDRFYDIERASGSEFGSDVMDVLIRFDALSDRAADLTRGDPDGAVSMADLGACVPRPRNVLAIGMNYRDHAAESKVDAPTSPVVFAKFPSCLAGPASDVYLSSDTVDYEVELVLVVGRSGKNIRVEDALSHLAGVTIGQDISDRRLQMVGSPPQFSWGKSVDTYGPLGPAVVSLDELGDVNDLGIWCDVDGERRQDSRTSKLIFSPEELVSYISSYVTLAPGDLIFTGTPAGVGSGFDPPRYLRDGSLIISGIEDLGSLSNRCRFS